MLYSFLAKIADFDRIELRSNYFYSDAAEVKKFIPRSRWAMALWMWIKASSFLHF